MEVEGTQIMASDDTSGSPGGFDFEEIRKLLEQMGLGTGDMDFNQLLEQVTKMQESGSPGFAMTNADKDPDAAWRTTITAAQQLTQGKGPDPHLEASERALLVDSERLAQSWLSSHTTFPETGIAAAGIRREEWLQRTSKGWRTLVEPIIDGLADALQRGASAESVPELGALSAMLGPMMRSSASLIYRDRLKKVFAEVAGSALTGTEVGINLMEGTPVLILTSNVAAFTEDLELPDSDVLLYLLVREAARQRLFHSVGWLSPQLNALLAHFAREISIDFEAISASFDPSQMEQFSLEDMVEVGEKVRGSFFKPASTPTQVEILGRLELLLALIEGWVDHVTARATGQWMNNASQLSEVVRRRRASGGPSQEVFNQLLGLDLRPRLVRDAENLWASIEHQRGDQRDAVWQHPDLLPTAADLKDPLAFGNRDADSSGHDDLDAELRKILGDGN